jgi:hypothetical protein
MATAANAAKTSALDEAKKDDPYGATIDNSNIEKPVTADANCVEDTNVTDKDSDARINDYRYKTREVVDTAFFTDTDTEEIIDISEAVKNSKANKTSVSINSGTGTHPATHACKADNNTELTHSNKTLEKLVSTHVETTTSRALEGCANAETSHTPVAKGFKKPVDMMVATNAPVVQSKGINSLTLIQVPVPLVSIIEIKLRSSQCCGSDFF